MELDPSVRDYYERGDEADRLSGGAPDGPLELARTKELLLRHLPERPSRILDVGGGPGVYAQWLSKMGHDVHVVDPFQVHVEQALAAAPTITAEVGDARQLDEPDASADVVLLLGPLYHLPGLSDRLQALREARRVLRPGGWLFAAAISRFAALLDLVVKYDRFHEPDVRRLVSDAVLNGTFRGAEGDLGFATAYCHLPRELAAEIDDAGLIGRQLYGIEGIAYLPPDIRDQWQDPARREALMDAARLTESDPEIVAASSHLLAVAQAPS